MRFPWQKKLYVAPPPPPSLHLYLGRTSDEFLLAAGCCAALALLILLAAWLKLRSKQATAKALVSVDATANRQGQVAVLRCGADTTLCQHTKRLLLQRGFAEVRCPSAGDALELRGACRGANVAIDLDGVGHDALLTACAAHGVGSILLCSDALVGYDAAADVTDGDERVDAGPSLERLTPRVPIVASGRLLALSKSEAALAEHAATNNGVSGLVLRLHRVYSTGAGLASFLPLLLASGVGVACGGARALTNLTHVEDAALGVVLATDKLLGGGGGGLETVVLTDPTVYAAAHLLQCLAAICRLPAPLAPLLLVPMRLLAVIIAAVGLPTPAALKLAHKHSYFTGEKAKKLLGFAPKAGANGLYTALTAVKACCAGLSLVAPLEACALVLCADAYSCTRLASAAGAACLLSLLYACLPSPKSLPVQPPIAPPVVDGGLPLLGHLLDFMKGPVSMFDGLRAKYRSMFTIKVGPQRITMMVGADATYAFIKQKDEMLDQAAVYGFTIPVFGKGIIYDSPLDERLQQVKLLVHSMNTKSLDNMVPKMISEAEQYFHNWGDEGVVELRHVFSELIIMTASSCLMGREVREGIDQDVVARIYHSLDGGLTPLSTLWPTAPTAAHRERDLARKEMEGIFSRVIANRRSGAAVEDDFLQKIIEFRYKDEEDPHTGRVLKAGRGFTDSEVVGLLVVLLFAGQHTSSITSTWLGARILSSPKALAELKAEQERMVPDKASLNYKNLLEMDCMRRSITEALRLYPPLVLLMRKVMKANFKVGPFTIPKGDVVGVCAPATNLDPRYWHDADEFRPSRFAAGGAEADTFDSRSVGHGLQQGMMMAFGGGAHMCSGRRFGFLQVSTIWSILLRDFDMEMTTPVPKPAYNDMVVGPDGPIMVKYKRKIKAA